MKIHYREFTLIEKMQIAIRDSKKPILYFEITQKEFDANYSRFDRSQQQDNYKALWTSYFITIVGFLECAYAFYLL